MAYESVFYCTANGEEPVKAFLEDLNFKIKQKFIARDRILLGEFGEKLPPPHSQLLEDGIFELKVDLGNLAYRFLYFLHGSTIVYVHAFMKKSQKARRRDIELAIARKKDFWQRMERGELEQ